MVEIEGYHFKLPNPRKYGPKPYRAVVLHGGPGVCGQMAPVARELSKYFGVLEPAQTKPTIEGLVDELHTILYKSSSLPVTVVGWSWGALLGLILAEKHPRQVDRLILISCPPLEERYAAGIYKTRMGRLDLEGKQRFRLLTQKLELPETKDKDIILSGMGKFTLKPDSYSLYSYNNPVV